VEEEIKDLIVRMINKDKFINSVDSISWKAHREAEKISNPIYIDKLVQIINTKPKKEERSAIYFIIGKICKNLNNEKKTMLMISFLHNETDKYLLSGILDRIAELPKNENTDLEIIYSLLHNDKWLIRHSAILSLNGSYSPRTEFELIQLLNQTNDSYDMCYCNSILSKIGTEKSLLVLQEMTKSRKRDVKSSAKYAIEEIKKKGA